MLQSGRRLAVGEQRRDHRSLSDPLVTDVLGPVCRLLDCWPPSRRGFPFSFRRHNRDSPINANDFRFMDRKISDAKIRGCLS